MYILDDNEGNYSILTLSSSGWKINSVSRWWEMTQNTRKLGNKLFKEMLEWNDNFNQQAKYKIYSHII